jgi:hypothetical protein
MNKDKENEPATVGYEDGLDDLFDDNGFIDAPSTPTPEPKSADRPQFRTPSPAEQAAQFIVDPGQKSAHVKEVMKLMQEPEQANPSEVQHISDAVGHATRMSLSPTAMFFAEFLQDNCRSNAFAHQTPSKLSKASPVDQTVEPHTRDTTGVDLPPVSGLGPDDSIYDLFDVNGHAWEGGNEIVEMTHEEEQKHIAMLMGYDE